MQDVDMDLDSESHSASLGDLDSKDDSEIPSIWSMDHDAGSDSEEDSDSTPKADNDENSDNDELEKPSFLRRFKRNKSEKSQEKTDEK